MDIDIRDRCSNIVFDTSIGNYKSLGWNSWCQYSFSRWECPRQYRKPGYSKVPLQIWYRYDYGNKLSLCMERIWVLLQVYMNIDVILLLDNFWMKLDCYMCIQTLEGMYNIGWPINEIHYALQHCSCCLHCQSLPLIISKANTTSYFPFSGEKEERRIFWQEENLLE